MSKSNKHFKRRLSLFLVFVLAFGSVVSVSAEELSQRNYSAKEDISYENYRLADLPEVIANSILTTDTTPVEIINQDTDDIYSITVKNSDGTNTLHIFQTPIKYVDGNSVKLKDTAINSSTKRISMFDTYAYESGDNEIKGYFPEHISDGVKVEYDDYSVTLTPMPDINLSNSEVKATSAVARVGNSVAYTDVFGENVSLEYFSTLNGVKENIILAEYSGKNTFSFIIDTDGLVPEKMSGDSIPLLDPETGEMKLYIGQINAKDSYTGDNENDDTHFTLYNSLELEQIGNKADVYKLTIVVDKEFLESETTVYPVTIDPTVSMAATNMSDAPVFSGYPTRNYYTNEYNMVGYHGSSYKEAISYVKLNTLSSYKYINPQKINLAYYRVYEGSGKTSTATINLYDTVSTWNDTTITYNNKPSFAGNAASSQTISSSGWYLFSITSLFKNWLQGTLGEGGFSHNYGFALSASTTGVSSRHFCSANSANYLPTIVVQYSEDTSIADGAYYIKSKYSNLYLDTEQNASANGNVIQYGFHGGANQFWIVKRQSDGYYKLYSLWYNETKCLDVTSNPTQNGSNVDVYDDGDGDYLLFKLVSNNDGSYRIISKWSGNQKVLDVCGPSTAPTANIQIWEYLNVDQQKWYFESAKPTIVSRASWGAEDFSPKGGDTGDLIINNQVIPNPTHEQLKQFYNMIVVHHTTRDRNEAMLSLQKAQKRKFADVGYHFAINADGTIFEGREIFRNGAHVAGQNSGKIGVALMGHLDPSPDLNAESTRPTEAQIVSLQKLNSWLNYLYSIDHVKKHKDLDNSTVCPGQYAEEALANRFIFR